MDKSTMLRGATYGIIGTLLMSAFMLIGMGSGLSPIPAPIPMVIADRIFGTHPQPLLMGFAIITHFSYGAFWGGVLFQSTEGGDSSFWYGLGMGVFLWLIMEIIVLPLLGWGLFGSAITPKIAIATLVLHLIYGGILGWGLVRSEHSYEKTPA